MIARKLTATLTALSLGLAAALLMLSGLLGVVFATRRERNALQTA
jgi:hypothetical protein